VNAGLKLEVTDRIGLFAYFEGEFSGHSQSYAGNGGLKISW
jgi:subtilase-type serine protease